MSLRALYDVPAPAKLNLFLHIVGRRPDGYHLLQSVFVLIDWHDTLHYERRDDGALHRHDLTQPLPADDLCLRAAHALQQASGCTLGADISIDKQLPSGAGMGGGSSDAASTLLALNRLWRLDWPRERLLGLALSLGADVPFFVGGENAWVEGIGERLTPVRLSRQWLAVVKPAESIATAALFAHAGVLRNSPAAILEGFRTSDGIGALHDDCRLDVALLEGYGRNDLQPAAESISAEVRVAGKLLEAAFGNSRMTGSGSAVFARVGTPACAAGTDAGTETKKETAWRENLSEGWSARMCRSLVRHPLAGWAYDAEKADPGRSERLKQQR